MKKNTKQILIFGILFVFFAQISDAAGPKKFNEKTYYHEDGSYVVSRITTGRGTGQGPDGYIMHIYDKDGNRTSSISNNDFSYIAYNSAGEVIGEYNHHSARMVYVLDEDNNIVGLKSSWTGPIVETYQYTDQGKMLVYDADGQLKGAYNDLVDYHTARQGNCGGWYRPSCAGLGEYAGGELSLLSEDGKFYDYDSQGNLLAVYESDGSMSKYDKGGNLIKQTDSSGKLLWARKIYTVQEAESVSKDGSVNSVRIRYK